MHSQHSSRPRKHILYKMVGKAKAPAGTGDTASWFRHYKWQVEGDVFVPAAVPFLHARPGDLIWFVLDGILLGHAIIADVREDVFGRRQEIWYQGHTVRPHPKAKKLRGRWGKYAPKKQAERWLKECYDALGKKIEETIASLEEQPTSSPKKESVIQRAPSEAELQALGIMRVAPERLGLMPVVFNGEDRTALLSVVNVDGDKTTVRVIAVLLKSGDKLLDHSGQQIIDSDELQKSVKSAAN